MTKLEQALAGVAGFLDAEGIPLRYFTECRYGFAARRT